jgi:hypothetical protein
VILLGPQRLEPTVAALPTEGTRLGPVTIVTAGWQERELEDEELREKLGVPAVNLELYRRWNAVLEQDPELAEAHRGRQDVQRQLQRLYRRRLSPLMESARQCLGLTGNDALYVPEQEAAVDFVRQLDAHHLARTAEVDAEFEHRMQPWTREPLARQRAEITGLLKHSGTLYVAGGHVMALLIRLRFMLPREALRGLPVVAWSAGAMALSERIVLFHDHPALGHGDAEVLSFGLGLYRDVVVLPHARHRLDLEDPQRVALMARRFEPAVCLPLDEGARVEVHDRLQSAPGTRHLHRDGLVEVTA